jgi:hypothetical protein
MSFLPPYIPKPADILCGLQTSNGATLITIPAGRIWSGIVTVSATALVASSGAAVSANARVSTAGTGVVPGAGDYVRLDLAAPASVLSAVGTASNSSISAPLIVSAPSGNSVALVLNTTNVNTASASACGVLL